MSNYPYRACPTCPHLQAKKLSVRKALKLFDAGDKGYLVYKGDMTPSQRR